jgi:putative RecB family exonuclease
VREENDEQFYRDQGARCLENYYRSNYPFEDTETVAVEHKVSFKLDPAGRYSMRGVIDRVARRRDGGWEIHDYKTSGSLPPASRLHNDRQLALYQIGLSQTWPDRVEGQPFTLVWHYLAFNKTLRSTRTPEQLDELRATLMERIDEIERETEFPARPSALCRWCEYADICDAAQQGAAPRKRRVPGFADAGLVGPGGPADAGDPGPLEDPATPAPRAGQLSLLD